MSETENLAWSVAVLVLFHSLAAAAAPDWISLNGNTQPEPPTASVVISNETEVIIDFGISGFYSEDLLQGDNEYQSLRLPDRWTTLDVGKPQLPTIVEMVAIPADADVRVTVSQASERVLTDYNVYPFQTPLLESEMSSGFDFDEELYSQSLWYPAEIASVGTPNLWRDLRVVKLVLCPFQYNAVRQELIAYTAVTIRLEYSGGSNANITRLPERAIPTAYHKLYRSAVLNYDFLNLPAVGTGGIDGDYDYLIIAVDSYVDNMTPFVNWKRSLGLVTQVTPLSAVGSTVADIKDYITQEYNTGNISYVLLVGNESEIPGYTGYGFFSDYYYSLVSGSDDYADIAIGRFCVHSESDVDVMIGKSIAYEYNPPPGDWLDNSLLVAHLELAPGKYQGCKEEIRTASYSYLPPEFCTAYGADYAQGGDRASNADVIAAIDAGQRLVNYRGHGEVDYWPEWNVFGEDFTTADVAQLNNGSLTPVVFSIACGTGDLLASTTCLGEAFTLDAEAAVAFLGASDPSDRAANHTYDKQLYLSIFDDTVAAVGDASNIAATRIINEHGTPGLTNARMYLWLGDPTIMIVYGGPWISADFTAVPTSGYAPLTVDFTDLSYGEITSWDWSFGDGETSTLQNPTYTYTGSGYYTVSLTVTGPSGSDTETKIDFIAVDSFPVRPLVCPTGPADFSTIQAAIDAASDGDTIELCDATFIGAGNHDLDYGGKALFIRSKSGDAEACIIDCQGTPSQPHRGFHFHSGEGPGSVLEGITITNGYAAAPGPGGAGVLVEGSSPTITGCILSDNTSGSFGGGMQSDTLSYPEVSYCTFSDNTAADDGGGLACFSGTTVQGCQFIGNVSTGGHGGGMASLPGSGAPDIICCTFSNNSAYYCGGGLSVHQFNGTLAFCTFSANTAPIGGGLYCANSSTATLDNCSFHDNTANNGGGIGVEWNSNAAMDKTIIAFSPAGTAVYCDATSAATINCCDVFGNTGGAGAVQGQISLSGNFSLDPVFCDTTIGDLRIGPASPCAAANNSCAVLVGAHDVGCHVCGDADGNEIVNISDAVYLIECIFAGGPPPEPMLAGDASCDEIVNVSDAVYLINYVFTGGPEPCANCCGYSGQGAAAWGLAPHSAVVGVLPRFAEPAESRVAEVTISSTTPVAGVQLEFDVNIEAVGEIIVEKTARSALLELFSRVRGDHLRVGLIDLSGVYAIPPGEESIVTLELERGTLYDIKLVDVVLADANARELAVTVEQPRKPSGLPTQFTLAQNHPNPFNPTTEVEYSLPRPAQVRLEVYNLLGQKIKTLIDKWQPAGRHRVRWEGDDDSNRSVASGVYFYRITAGDYTDSKKMLLLK